MISITLVNFVISVTVAIIILLLGFWLQRRRNQNKRVALLVGSILSLLTLFLLKYELTDSAGSFLLEKPLVSTVRIPTEYRKPGTFKTSSHYRQIDILSEYQVAGIVFSSLLLVFSIGYFLGCLSEHDNLAG